MDLSLLDSGYSQDQKDVSNNAVLMLRDGDDATFLNTCLILIDVYKKACDVNNIQYRKSKLENLKTFLNNYHEKQMVIHYIGHGRASAHSFPLVEMDGKDFDLYTVLKQANYKGLLILDCCNIMPQVSIPPQGHAYQGVDILFSLKGFNVIAAVQKGYATYYFTGLRTVFSIAFEFAINSPRSDIESFLIDLNLSMRSLFVDNHLNMPYFGDIIDFEIDPLNGVIDKSKMRIKVMISPSSNKNVQLRTQIYNKSPVVESHYINRHVNPIEMPNSILSEMKEQPHQDNGDKKRKLEDNK